MNNEQKIILFNDLINIIVNCLHQDYLLNQINFNQKKYHRFFVNLVYLISNNTDNNYVKTKCLLLICDIFKLLSPRNYPGFALAWLNLISYHYFINNFISINLVKENAYKYEKYLSLLTELLSYLSSLKNQLINNYYFKVFLDEVYQFFYVLSNKYSSFVTSYCYMLIPYLSLSSDPNDQDNNSFLQLKNIILSASPIDSLLKDNNNTNDNKEINKNYYKENFLSMKLFRENLISNKIIYLLFDNDDKIKNEEDTELNNWFDKFILSEKNDENFLESLLSFFDKIKDEKELINAYNGIMIYWCYKKQKYIAEDKIKSKKAFYSFYYFLICNLDEINKKYLIDSILNALRFPCSQAISYSLLFQELFINIDNEDIEKQLMENILERALYNPIPWGIKYTLNCLLNNEKYQQLEKKYIKNNVEVIDFISKINKNLIEKEFKK
jgi:CCR4-NOT transcription complex subunit 1